MTRSFALVSAFLIAVAGSGFAQSSMPPRTLGSITHELAARPEGLDLQLVAGLDGVVQAATMVEIKQTLPELVELTESSNPQLRGGALLILDAIAGRQKAGLPENRREIDASAVEAIVPYIARLKPRLMDSEIVSRVLSLNLFGAIAFFRPSSPELIKAAMEVLQSPQSTQATAATRNGSPEGRAPAIGPDILWVLLHAGATFYPDPTTSIAEGRDSPEVQEAIIAFLDRPDQTSESLSESIRSFALAQAQNPAVNAHLLMLLDSSDITVQEILLRNIARLTLSPEDFASARARVTLMTTDPAKPTDIQRIAKSILPCWTNDRHRGVCPP